MRLLTVTLRNYRLHRELEIELDPSRTVIGGPNETGKSTLVEAMHRALFLKAKITGETQRGMVSDFHPGHPEVTVSFEAGGCTYRILKRFSGATGTATLTQVNGPTWTGDEAESRLADLLGVEASAGGRGAGERAAQQWAHLWVWQGQAGNDPTPHANEQRDTLLARLQGSTGLGAVVMQSERDARVAARFAAACESLFNKNGSPRKDSDQGRALEAAGRARTGREQAQATFDQLQQAMAAFEAAEKVIQASAETLPRLRAQKTDVETKLARVAELRATEKTQSIEANAAAEKLRAAQEGDRQIRELRAEAQRRASELAPQEAETQRLATAEAASRRRQSEAEEGCRKAARQRRAAGLRHEFAGAWVGLLHKTTLRDRLQTRLAEVRQLRVERDKLLSDLAGLPLITPAGLKALEKLEKARDKAEAALAAMAAGIEILASDLPVRAGDALLDVGETRVLTEDTEIAIGPRIRLRITPGGGTTLAKARVQLQEAKRALQHELDTLGLPSTSAASEACTRRQHLEEALRTMDVRLESAGANTIEQELAEAENTRAALGAEVARRGAAVEEFAAPKDTGQAGALAAATEAQLRDADTAELAAEASRRAAGEALVRATTSLAEHRQTIQNAREALTRLDAQGRLLLEQHGEDTERGRKLQDLLAASREAGDALAATRRALAGLQPDLLAGDLERLQRSLDQAAEARQQAEQARAVAQNLLCSDGTADPQEALALAKAEEGIAEERLALAVRHAGAIRRLHELFVGEQRSLAEQFTRPLAEKVSGYLQCLFGSGAQAQMSIEANAFRGLCLARAGESPGESAGAFTFEALSGGAREQVAAAVRLGMAEVLAAGHDGCLPLVFDDAFAYSDPERVQTLQRMLDLATRRGLQILVLTCNPADYAALGAKPVLLHPATRPARTSPEPQGPVPA